MNPCVIAEKEVIQNTDTPREWPFNRYELPRSFTVPILSAGYHFAAGERCRTLASGTLNAFSGALLVSDSGRAFQCRASYIAVYELRWHLLTKPQTDPSGSEHINSHPPL